ncbi:MAG: RHS repeat-associated core domain-containing protein [Caldilinea sp. CFX5]|nr:RHS repeat-associated core domain-containing protein [Caldilinea sp. CFX5]
MSERCYQSTILLHRVRIHHSSLRLIKYYQFNGQTVAIRKNGVLSYQHGDHLGSTVATTNGSGSTTGNTGYFAYGRQRTGNELGSAPIGHPRFTGQKLDGAGLIDMNARYYDPELGQFLSPDTLVPEPTNLFDYNRYMFVRGNPMRYNDPTGHYSNEEIMQHFGCDTWGCVEANFNEGGSLDGAWGWLNVLQAAQDGDTVASTMLTQLEGQAGSTNTSLLGTIRRGENGRIGVQLTTFVGADYSQSALDGTLDGDAFAQFAKAGDVGMYGVKGGVTYMHNAQAVCYTWMQCSTQTLDAVSTGSSAVAALCLGTGVGAPCAGAAGMVSTATGAAGTVLTGISAYQGEASALDVGVGIVTTITGGAGGTVGKGSVGVASSLFQWWWDQ